MRYFFVTLVMTVSFFSASSQTSVPVTRVKKVKTLKMARDKDIDPMPGTRGASVAWHPVFKKYYAAMAGNIGYPLCIFDAAGKRVSPDSLNCEVDVRGLWYNADKKTIQGNSFDAGGWFRYDHDTKGMIREVQYLTEEMTQPNAQSVGAANSLSKQIMFLHQGEIWFYSMEEPVKGATLTIHWGRTKADGMDPEQTDPVTPSAYNSTTVIYTGIKRAELGFLKPESYEIELYDVKTGFLTRSVKLPADAPMNASFNFAYANGMYWLFNIETREWSGYK
ncbi:MAG TPA: hypothetical protein VMZ03_14260 [Chitinophagaceae bacterium]|nr:hypothetical protein [Chitinophagaceae bacterium]